MKSKISVLGAGRMGSALVQAFLAQGHEVVVWNRTASRCAPLVALGARAAGTVEEAAAEAAMVVANVNDYASSEAILYPDRVVRALRGKTLIQLTSGSARRARQMAAWAKAHEIPYLDGAILVTPHLIGKPDGAVLYSGPNDLFERCKPALLALGGNAIYLGEEPGSASALDSALLAFFWGPLFSALLGAAVCEAEKFPLQGYIDSLRWFTPVLGKILTNMLDRVRDRRFAGDEDVAATVETCHAGVRHLLELCEEHGIDRRIPQVFDGIFQEAVAAGHAKDAVASLMPLLRPRA